MGCDIHAYIEYRVKQTPTSDEYDKKWRNFGHKINPGRNYLIFSIMAGVRGEESDALFPPKGYPKDAGYAAEYDNFLYINDDEVGDNNVTKERAETYVKYGCVYKNNYEGKPAWVSHPDWHSHSWLTLNELQLCFKEYINKEHLSWEELEKQRKELSQRYKEIPANSWVGVVVNHDLAPEYQAVIASMEKFESLGYETRLVFWFDN